MLLQWMGEHHDKPVQIHVGDANEPAVDAVLTNPETCTVEMDGEQWVPRDSCSL